MTTIFASLFGLMSMLAYGFANTYAKPLSQRLNTAKLIFLRGCVLVVLLTVAAIPYYGHLVHWKVALATLGLGAAGYLPVLTFTKAIRVSPLGIVAPITGTSTLFTVLLSVVFLNVVLHPVQWVAAGLVVAANIAISTDLKNLRQSRLLNLSTGVPLALASTFGFGLFYFLLIPATKVLSPVLASFLVELGITVMAIMHIKLFAPEASLVETLKTLSPAVALNGALLGVGMLAFTVGVKYYNAGVVTILSNSSALVTTVAGAYIFHERLSIKDRIAAGVAILSIAALSVF